MGDRAQGRARRRLWMLTLLLYRRYVLRPGPARYAAVLAGVALALMAKPVAVTLPLVLLLLDVWPFRRLRGFDAAGAAPGLPAVSPARAVAEKLPLLALAAYASWMTVLCQKSFGAVGNLESFPLSLRIANAVVSYAAYLRKLAWPLDLAVLYPIRPGCRRSPWRSRCSCWSRRRCSSPGRRVAIPPRRLALVPGGPGADDRAGPDRPPRGDGGPVRLPARGGFVRRRDDLVCRLGVHLPPSPDHARRSERRGAARARADRAEAGGGRRDSETLFRHALAAARDASEAGDLLGRPAAPDAPARWTIHLHLGKALVERGRLEEGIAMLRKAAALEPADPLAHYHLGAAHRRRGRPDLAAAEYRAALALDAGNFPSLTELAQLELDAGRTVEALPLLGAAARLAPGHT